MTSTRQQQRQRMLSVWVTAVLLLQNTLARAFMMRTPPSPPKQLMKPLPSPRTYDVARLVTSRLSTQLLASTISPDKMKAGEIRKELESYGINTKSFLEKKELVEALEKARAEGKKPIKETTTVSTDDKNGKQEEMSSASRKEKIEAEKEKAKSMKVGELKKALQDMGVSTKSFFEKSEFVQAYAEAMVDGPPKKRAGTSAGRRPPREEQKYDPSYRDVTMQKFDPRMLGRSTIIDVQLGR